MCGICGFSLSSINNSDIIRSTLNNMLDSISHRGPDASGTWMNNYVAFGHKRLSIIDIEKGHQPMKSDLGNLICFNGEIYNFKEIRKILTGKGCQFRTNSDTEIIIKAYEIYGSSCVDHFIGMFSFVIYEPAKNRLFLARDRLGQKPLFYYHYNNSFIFGSEIKSLLAHPSVYETIEINLNSISDYFSLGYILGPKTIYKHINRFPESHYGFYCFSSNKLSITKYWKIEDYYQSNKLSISKKTSSTFDEILYNSVKIRLQSDVPLGASLSGGIDSSSILYYMKHSSNRQINAFNVRFGENSFDESKYAKTVADHLQINLQNICQIMPSETDLSDLVWHLDEPFCDTSIIPSFLLFKASSKFVKVMLSGDGADELLAGYMTVIADIFFNIYSHTPLFIKEKSYSLFKNFFKPSFNKVSNYYKCNQFLSYQGKNKRRAHYYWRQIFSDSDKSNLLNNDILNNLNEYDPFLIFDEKFNQVPKATFLDQTLFVDIKTWLVEDILVKIDRMSMANSLEVRSPFLDHRLFEYTARLPQKYKISHLKQKNILKKVMINRLPKSILTRAKSGFNYPTHLLCQKEFLTPTNSDFFNDKFSFSSDNEDSTFKSFSLTIFNHWLAIYNQYKRTKKWEKINYEI